MRVKIRGIYRIRNKLNGKVYIGSAEDIVNRFYGHKSILHKNKHHSILLQRAWNKYGEDQFVFKVIEKVEKPLSLRKREQYWINFYDAANPKKGYNRSPTAGSNKHLVGKTKPKKKVECKYCKEVFYLTPFKVKRIKYCSVSCRNKGRVLVYFKRTRARIKCTNCKRVFIVMKFRAKSQKFCSKKCFGKFRIGTKLSLKVRRKISKACMGKGGKITNPPVKHFCKICNKVFYKRPSLKAKCCSAKCRCIFIRKTTLIECKGCKKITKLLPYLVKSANQKFCTNRCYQKYRRNFFKLVTLKCKKCNKKFIRHISRKALFCSNSCSVSYRHARNRLLKGIKNGKC